MADSPTPFLTFSVQASRSIPVAMARRTMGSSKGSTVVFRNRARLESWEDGNTCPPNLASANIAASVPGGIRAMSRSPAL